MHQVQTLTASSSELEVKLVALQRLARQVFEPQTPEAEYEKSPPISAQLQLDNWKQRLCSDNAAIFYVTAESSLAPPQPGDSQTAPLQAFFFVHPRPLSKSQETLHVYLAAVHPSARGQGIFSVLLDETKKRAKGAGFQVLTVSTIPARFPRMYEILSKPGSGWNAVEWADLEDGGRKVIMKMVVD
ncbi:hypothetical protein PMZ80_005278 [Knufia obscura]|uniref:N-acetyltransferase domain-containing protein n=2 Tax=Knufia TaxID=430999 RepID=A0AAN8EWU2_9EURO|nr:hypothetical protein PMZ80_005278 [Knufia obscura]KAK5957945.1 hypothetical protein OHC33_001135 [Knufia fluminis]